MPDLSKIRHHYFGAINSCVELSGSQISASEYVSNVELQLKVMQCTENNASIRSGGHFNAISRIVSASVAIIIPYRNRSENLRTFLGYIHPFLQQQNLEYKIYVITQSEDDGLLFNRGMLINIGFEMSMLEKGWEGFIFHDVDLLPENPENRYECWDLPRHMNVASSKNNYSLPYWDYTGGVASITPYNYRKLNGFSNRFFGWGGEDDDFYFRIVRANMYIERSNATIGRYLALDHAHQQLNEERWELLSKLDSDNDAEDGLNSLQYRLLHIKEEHLFTNITVNISNI